MTYKNKAITAGLALTLAFGACAAPAIADYAQTAQAVSQESALPAPAGFDRADEYAQSASVSSSMARIGTVSVSDEMKYFTKFESNANYNQGFSYGDGYNAMGYYQFDRRHSLVPFMQACYDYDSKTYACFKPVLDRGGELKTAPIYDRAAKRLTPIGQLANDAWHTAYANDPTGFSALQDSFSYENYYLPVQRILAKSYGVDISGRADCVKGLAWGMCNLFGSGGVQKFFLSAGLSNGMGDREMASALCDAVVSYYSTGAGASHQYAAGYVNRYQQEKVICLGYIEKHEQEGGQTGQQGGTTDPAPEAKPEPQPEPAPEPAPEPEPEPEPAPEPAPEPESAPQPEPEPQPEARPDLEESAPAPQEKPQQPVPQPAPESAPDLVPAPQQNAPDDAPDAPAPAPQQQDHVSKPSSTPRPAPQAAPAPTTDSKPTSAHQAPAQSQQATDQQAPQASASRPSSYSAGAADRAAARAAEQASRDAAGQAEQAPQDSESSAAVESFEPQPVAAVAASFAEDAIPIAGAGAALAQEALARSAARPQGGSRMADILGAVGAVCAMGAAACALGLVALGLDRKRSR